MTSTLIDTNILIDIFGIFQPERDWAARKLTELRPVGRLLINQIVFSELASMLPFDRLLNALSTIQIERENLSFEASWFAGDAHANYRKAGGNRERTLPDFLIGAHAANSGYRLLTRDPKRYRSYFTDLKIIAPDTHP